MKQAEKDFTEKILDIIFEDFFDIMETITAEEAEKVIKSFSPLGISKDEYIEILQNKLMNTQILAIKVNPLNNTAFLTKDVAILAIRSEIHMSRTKTFFQLDCVCKHKSQTIS